MAIMNIRLCQIRISYSDEQGSNIYKTCTRELAHISACFYKYWYSANAEEQKKQFPCMVQAELLEINTLVSYLYALIMFLTLLIVKR